jgi:hypothetical protein
LSYGPSKPGERVSYNSAIHVLRIVEQFINGILTQDELVDELVFIYKDMPKAKS